MQRDPKEEIEFVRNGRSYIGYYPNTCKWLNETFDIRSETLGIVQMTISGKIVKYVNFLKIKKMLVEPVDPKIRELSLSTRDFRVRHFTINDFAVPGNPLGGLTSATKNTRIIPDDFMPDGVIRFESGGTVAYMEFDKGDPGHASSGISEIPGLLFMLAPYYDSERFNAKHYYNMRRSPDYYRKIDERLKREKYDEREFEFHRVSIDYKLYVMKVGVFDDNGKIIDGYSYVDILGSGEHPAISGRGTEVYIDRKKRPEMRISDFYNYIEKFDPRKELDKELATRNFEEKLACMRKNTMKLDFSKFPQDSGFDIHPNSPYSNHPPNPVDDQKSLSANLRNMPRFVLVRQRH